MFSNDTIDTYSIPIIVVKNIIPLPNNEIKFDVLNPVALAAIKAASQTKKYVGIFLPKNPLVENYNFSNIQPVGVVCELSYFIEGGTSKAKMLGIVRARLNAIEQETPYLVGNVTSMPKFSEDTSAELTYVKILVSEIEKNGTRILGSNRDIITLISQGVTPDKLTDILAFNMKLDIASKLKYLQTPSITMRLRFLVEDIKREKQLAEIGGKDHEKSDDPCYCDGNAPGACRMRRRRPGSTHRGHRRGQRHLLCLHGHSCQCHCRQERY